jgi:hypothetical protein
MSWRGCKDQFAVQIEISKAILVMLPYYEQLLLRPTERGCECVEKKEDKNWLEVNTIAVPHD